MSLVLVLSARIAPTAVSADAAEEQVRLLISQISDARNDATEQRRIAIDALAETGKSADAAKLSAEVADKSARAFAVAERAMIVVGRFQIERSNGALAEFAEGQRLGIRLSPSNEGRTNAVDIVGEVHCALAEPVMPLPSPAVSAKGAAQGIGPQREFRVETTKMEPVSAEHANLLKSGNLSLCVWGAIASDDVFDVHHVVHFGQAFTDGVGFTTIDGANRREERHPRPL